MARNSSVLSFKVQHPIFDFVLISGVLVAYCLVFVGTAVSRELFFPYSIAILLSWLCSIYYFGRYDYQKRIAKLSHNFRLVLASCLVAMVISTVFTYLYPDSFNVLILNISSLGLVSIFYILRLFFTRLAKNRMPERNVLVYGAGWAGLETEIKNRLKKHLKSNPNSQCVLKTTERTELDNFKSVNLIVNLEAVNNIRYVNKFHEAVNEGMDNGGIYLSCAETLEQRKRRYFKKAFYGFKWLVQIIDFIWKRAIPKLPLFKNLYFAITNGRNRVMSKTEVLGRLISCGFEIQEYFEHTNKLYIISRKVKESEYNMQPSYGPLFRMNRVGYNGNMIGVYKFRTMYPYSEYCQEMVVRENKLENGGKIDNDYRVTKWGEFFRKHWIDELPMIFNVLKGELNIVGIRPLSRHYFSLYPAELQQLRIKVKPGLVPPYYADLPENFEKILESEKKYVVQKLRSPVITDVKYFCRAFVNIVFRGARSK